MAKTMTFLVNPSGRRVRLAKGHGRKISANPSTSRGGSRGTKTAAHSNAGTAGEGKSMATKTKRRRGAGGRFLKAGATKAKRRRNPAPGAIANPPRRRRRRHSAAVVRRARRIRTRRNPPGLMDNVIPFASEAVMGAAGVLGGKLVARKARGLAGQQAGTLLGCIVEAGAGIAAGLVVSTFDPVWGERFAVGGLLAPMETLVQQLKLPGISDTLGDDGFVVGGDSGVDLVSAYDDGATLGDGDDLAGYIGGGDSLGEDTLAGYVTGYAA